MVSITIDAADLAQLDYFLQDKSYLEGFSATQADLDLVNLLKGKDTKKYQSITRYINHIGSFTLSQSTQFPKNKITFVIGGAAAAPKAASPVKAAAPAPKAAATPAPKAAKKEEDDDDLDLFGSDEEEDAENEKLKAERVAAYNAKKAQKPKTIAKSMIVLDVKPWDDETDMEQLKKNVLAIEMEGLTWGTHKLVPVGYGIKKLSVTMVVVDDLVSVDDVVDKITADEDHVQSVDVASFNKL